ncbi:MAG: acyloxyacyl hydrolase [Proteobacteria bacterium]|nr:acyloxyacyl hydrolase [Pseudomonadota bacterium]
MKKLIVILTGFICATGAAAAADSETFNPFFGDRRNQVQLILGQGFDSGELILFNHLSNPAPYYMIALSYSQPNTFFRLPGRQTISAIKTLGWGKHDYNGKCRFDACDWGNYGDEIAMLSQDFVFSFFHRRMYAGAGSGVAVQGQQNGRLNTKFLIPFRMFIGYRFNDSWNAEFIMQHFSNGDTGDQNNVYDFFALSVLYNF